ncbi:MAG: cytochrome c [Myxococcota bacterium]
MRTAIVVLLGLTACEAAPRDEMAATGSRPDTIDTLAVDDALLADINPDIELRFQIKGTNRPTLKVRDLIARLEVREVEIDDPNHKKEKRFAVIPLLPVLLDGLGLDESALADTKIVMEARDGYASPVDGKILTATGAWLALDDLSVPGWETIGEKKADPAPLYVVWTGDRDPHLYPWPWALSLVRTVSEDEEYGAADPGESASALAKSGHTLFLKGCIRCHAMNRAGGRLGPELNVPQSIVEYRPVSQIKDYIRNPLTFRYGNMPANPHLSEADLDALVAYFETMKSRKVSP